MFTGIIEEVGRIKGLSVRGANGSITVECDLIRENLRVGDSVSVNGVCLSVVEMIGNAFTADVSGESLRRSTLGGMKMGDAVNLERALSLESRLGGHIVQGHVDAVGRLKAVREAGEGRVYTFAVPAEIEGYLVEKGSIAVDGISLTVSELGGGEFSVAVIPLTIRGTNLERMRNGDPVNLEVDVIAKYVRKYLEGGSHGPLVQEGNEDSLYKKLAEGGFI